MNRPFFLCSTFPSFNSEKCCIFPQAIDNCSSNPWNCHDASWFHQGKESIYQESKLFFQYDGQKCQQWWYWREANPKSSCFLQSNSSSHYSASKKKYLWSLSDPLSDFKPNQPQFCQHYSSKFHKNHQHVCNKAVQEAPSPLQRLISCIETNNDDTQHFWWCEGEAHYWYLSKFNKLLGISRWLKSSILISSFCSRGLRKIRWGFRRVFLSTII